jgi:hypothetical protein
MAHPLGKKIVYRLAGPAAPMLRRFLYVDATQRIYPALAIHSDRYREALGAQDLTSFEMRVFSQSGEDGVIAEILSRIGITNKWFVEFGIGTGHQGNCVLLADVYGWNGLFCEPDAGNFSKLQRKYLHNPNIQTEHVAITPANIEEVFDRRGVPEELDVLSIDVDTIDYWIWKALNKYRPRLLVVEYNGSLNLDQRLAYPEDTSARWDEATRFYGSSLGAFRQLAEEKNYQLVHTEMNGVNAFFVPDDLASLVGVPLPPMRSANFGLTGGEMPPDSLKRSWVTIDKP